MHSVESLAAESSTASTSALETVTTAIATPIGQMVDAVSGALTPDHDASPSAQRERMREFAGPEHFRHSELGAGREEMARHRAGFAAQREGLSSPIFAASRSRFATGRTRPAAGPVIGSAIHATLANPDLARGILTGVASAQGVPVVSANPILAELLPGFGN